MRRLAARSLNHLQQRVIHDGEEQTQEDEKRDSFRRPHAQRKAHQKGDACDAHDGQVHTSSQAAQQAQQEEKAVEDNDGCTTRQPSQEPLQRIVQGEYATQKEKQGTCPASDSHRL